MQPRWRADGRELFYLAPDGTMMAVDIVSMRPAFKAGAPRRLFKTRVSLHHIALEVPDMAKAVADLEKRPARRNYSRPMEIRTGTNRKRQMNLFDPDGTRSELMEPTTVDGKPAPSSSAPPPR